MPGTGNKIDARSAVVVVVDVQERLAQAVHETERLQSNVVRLVKGAGLLDVPVVATAQYPKGLGPVVSTVADALPGDVTPVEKTAFSCLDEQAFTQRWDVARTQVVLSGIEAHVCVLQTALDFLARGAEVFVVEDAVSSRAPDSKRAGVERIARAGGVPVTTEMVLFELTRDAAHPHFREVQALVK